MKVRHVYFIQARMLGHVKIGLSDDAEKRLRDLQVGSPDELVLRGVLLTDDAEKLEAMYHARFAHLRIRGEWFRNDRELEELLQQSFSPTEIRERLIPIVSFGKPERGSRYMNRARGESAEDFARRATRWANKRLEEMETAA